MDDPAVVLIQLMDQAQEVARLVTQGPDAPLAAALVVMLDELKARIASGALEPSAGLLSLGLTRQVADQVEALNSPLLPAVAAIDHHYLTCCREWPYGTVASLRRP